ncbi:MAG: general stress protein CsbD [Bacteroidia bacterium]|nr:general stress protein CsbD [Bacteroidia bacterium]
MTEKTTSETPVLGNWSDQKNKLKAKFSTLTDADLHFEEGKKDEMLNKVQIKLGKTKEQLAQIISTL